MMLKFSLSIIAILQFYSINNIENNIKILEGSCVMS